MSNLKNLVRSVCAVICVLCFTSCGKQSPPAVKGPVTVITNLFIDGQWHEVLTLKSGIQIQLTAGSDIVIAFREDSTIAIGFDPETLAALNVTLRKPASAGQPAESILDGDADGVPEIKKVDGEIERQIFYRGEWYARESKGTKTVITVDGREVEVHFDGRRYVEK